MKTQAQFRALSKTGLGALTLIMSLALLLGPAQTSFAKNTPITPVDQQGTTSGGGGSVPIEQRESDGGGGIVDVDRIGTSGGKGYNPTAALYEGGKTGTGGGSFGVMVFEWLSLEYYKLMWNLHSPQITSESPWQTADSGGTDYE